MVHPHHEQLHQTLNALKDAVAAHPTMADADKRHVTAKIEDVKGQLVHAQPDRNVVKNLWTGIERAVVAADLIDYAVKVGALIAPLIA